jgi:hypothetical protein
MVTTALPQKVSLFCPKSRLEEWIFGQRHGLRSFSEPRQLTINAVALTDSERIVGNAEVIPKTLRRFVLAGQKRASGKSIDDVLEADFWPGMGSG